MDNFIIEVLKQGAKELNPEPTKSDYLSGFNDGAYTLWRYLFEPTSIPPETRQKVETLIREAQKMKP